VHVLATALGLSLLGRCGGFLIASTLVSFPPHVRTGLVAWLVRCAVGAVPGVSLRAVPADRGRVGTLVFFPRLIG
jgi:hypothetical protein